MTKWGKHHINTLTSTQAGGKSPSLQFFKESHLLAGIEGKEETLILPKNRYPLCFGMISISLSVFSSVFVNQSTQRGGLYFQCFALIRMKYKQAFRIGLKKKVTRERNRLSVLHGFDRQPRTHYVSWRQSGE
jgi:hypothetical protein